MQVNIIICGAIRDRFDLLMILQKLLAKRHDGFIQEIILSTWIGEIDAYPDLRDVLTQSGIDIIENKPINQTSVGNILQQQKCLDSGMTALKDKSYPILKIRTDKCFHLLDSFLKYIEANNSLQKRSTLNGVFDYKIIIQMVSISIPFLVADKIFLGSYNDLRKLTFHTDFYDNGCIFHKTLGAENRWFLMPFILQYPVIRDFIANVNLRSVSTFFINEIIKKENCSLPRQVKVFYEFYYKLLYENFVMINNSERFESGWKYITSNFADKNIFLIEDRGIRKDLHAKSQSMLAAFAAIDYDITYTQQLDVKIFDDFINEDLDSNRALARTITRNNNNNSFLLDSKLIARLPISAKSNELVSSGVVQLVNKGVTAQEIYYRSALMLLEKDKATYFDDIVILLKNAAKSKHAKSLYLLYCFFKDSLNTEQVEFANYCLHEAAIRGNKEALSVVK